MLTKRDFQFLRQSISGEMMTYLGHAMNGGLRPGHETEHLEYLKGLADRLTEAEGVTPEA